MIVENWLIIVNVKSFVRKYLLYSLHENAASVTQFSLLLRPIGGAAQTQLEWAVHPERGSVRSASAHGSSAGGGWLSLFSHVSRARGVLHGPGQGLPGPGGQAEQAAGGLGWVQLS